MIVGTAGHIDHGKTSLVKALTGTDTDRLKEEKARGISIDLGFAYATLIDGRVTGFVDVPGHERFVHTMAAGAAGVDLALLVVALDDGIMPQTREHLAILDLFGIRRGVVALTKADRGDAHRRAVVASEIRTVLAATALRDAPILPVSIVTGEGIDTLRMCLAEAERDTVPVKRVGLFRLAVDRCFILPGAGTVVTGTVLSGRVTVGDAVLVSPPGLRARVRSIHAQNRPVASGEAGQRCALNLVGEGIAKDAIGRGDMIVAAALHAPTERCDAVLRVLGGEPKAVGTWFPARLHLGSAEVGARIVPLMGAIAPGGSGLIQLVLERPIAAAVGDALVLRDASARRTIGGGRLLDLRAPARKRRTPERLAVLAALEAPDPAQALLRLLLLPPYLVDLTAFSRDHALACDWEAPLRAVEAIVLEAAGSRLALAGQSWNRLADNLQQEVACFHADNPDLQGVGRERLRLRVEPRLPASALTAALQRMAQAGTVVLDGAFVRLPGHAVLLGDADEDLWNEIAPHLEGPARFRPPRVRDLAGLLARSEPAIRHVLRLSARLGRVDEIAPDHYFARSITIAMAALVRDAAAQASDGCVTAAMLRDRLDNGRKVAIHILDFFDRHGVTMRRGDKRRINPHRLDLFGPVADGRDASPVGRPDFKSG